MSDLSTIVGLGVVPDVVSVADTAANIAADLGGVGNLITYRSLLGALTVTPSGVLGNGPSLPAPRSRSSKDWLLLALAF